MWRGCPPTNNIIRTVEEMYYYNYEYTMKVQEKVEKEYGYLRRFIARTPKSKTVIFENGCLNYPIKEVRVADDRMSIEIYLDGMRPYRIEGDSLVDGDVKLGKDRKYSIVSYIRMR